MRIKPYILYILAIIFVASSCVTQRACLERFPPDTVSVQTVVYRDTIITVPVFSVDDTTVVWGTVFDTVYASSGTAHAITYVVRDTIRMIVWQSDTTLSLKLDSAIKVIESKDAEIYTIQASCEKGKGERFLDKLIMLVAVILIGAVVIYLIKLFK